jgi:hypothetical protein
MAEEGRADHGTIRSELQNQLKAALTNVMGQLKAALTKQLDHTISPELRRFCSFELNKVFVKAGTKMEEARDKVDDFKQRIKEAVAKPTDSLEAQLSGSSRIEAQMERYLPSDQLGDQVCTDRVKTVLGRDEPQAGRSFSRRTLFFFH